MGSITSLRSAPQHTALTKMYKDVGWDAPRQHGFCRRVIGHEQPRTRGDAQKLYQALHAMLLRLVRPYRPQLRVLVNTLAANRADLSEWERQFVADQQRRLSQHKPVTVQMIKKTRQIAHVRGVDCGFPSFRELAKADDARRARRREHT